MLYFPLLVFIHRLASGDSVFGISVNYAIIKKKLKTFINCFITKVNICSFDKI